ncbi:MAG: glycosyltransferase family 9 protein [Longimicrobiales bacterium]|nr:glycosyltransferase family 9 protein [Longimicrobiales bacterium]
MAPTDAAGRRRVVRAPNHLGDVVTALPALVADGSDVMVRRWLAPLLEMAALPGQVHPLDRGSSGWLGAVRLLRRRAFEEGVLLTPSFSAAWLFRWGGVARLRGTDTDGRGWLLADAVPREALRGHRRIDQYRLLLGRATGAPAGGPTLTPPRELLERWRKSLGDGGPLVGLVPGSNAPARRWPPDRFAAVARALIARGCRVAVLGSAAEQPITDRVCAAAPGSRNEGGKTDLRSLAAVLSLCRVVITNDTGPMHLAGAVGARTVTLWGPSDPDEVAHQGEAQPWARGAGLPCQPCFKNHCPRSGPGTMLPEAYEECMRLIDVERVLASVQNVCEGGRT